MEFIEIILCIFDKLHFRSIIYLDYYIFNIKKLNKVFSKLINDDNFLDYYLKNNLNNKLLTYYKKIHNVLNNIYKDINEKYFSKLTLAITLQSTIWIFRLMFNKLSIDISNLVIDEDINCKDINEIVKFSEIELINII